MRLTRLVSLVLWSSVAVAAPATSPSAAVPSAAPKQKAPVPKAMPRKGDGEAPSALPAFMGVFGPAKLIEKTGFRSAPGKFAEYDGLSATGQSSGNRMRFQEVGGAPAGRRWIEILVASGQMEFSGVRILTKGLGDKNVEKLVASMPGLPPMEFPLDSVSMTPDRPGQGDAPVPVKEMPPAEVRKAARETITVPAGRFECDHWIADTDGRRFDYWVTTDPSVPFIGAVKYTAPEGTMVLSKVGANATGVVGQPMKMPGLDSGTPP